MNEIETINFENIELKKNYIIEFIPNSFTSEKFMSIKFHTFIDSKLFFLKTLRGTLYPKCVGMISPTNVLIVEKEIELRMKDFKYKYNIYDI